jgi:hypothetical protein
MTELRISAKNLVELGLPGFCPRCIWLKGCLLIRKALLELDTARM